MFEGLKDDLKKPVNAISLLLAVVGIVLSVYFYLKSEKAGRIYYQVQQVLAFDQNQFSPDPANPGPGLFVVDRDGRRIDANVYAATIKVWNAGSDNIKHDDVRRSFSVKMPDSMTLISASVASATMENADEFDIDKLGHIKWTDFDPGQGATFRLIYTSKSQQQLELDGFAANAGTPKNADFGRGNFPSEMTSLASIAVMMVMIGPMLLFPFSERLRNSKIVRMLVLSNSIFFIITFLVLCLNVLVSAGWLFPNRASPPF